jgi:hypothetical protein
LALLLPVLFFLALATIDFGRLFYATCILSTCARNGALYASDPGIAQAESPYASVTSAAQADASNLSPLPTVDTPVYCATINGTYSSTPLADGYVQVTVHWTFTTIITYPGIPHTMSLSRTARMRLLPS